MFGIGMTELLVILVLALLVLGPKRLPEMARSLGRGLAEFRRASTDIRREFLDVSEQARIDPLESTDEPEQGREAAAQRGYAERRRAPAEKGSGTDAKPEQEPPGSTSDPTGKRS